MSNGKIKLMFYGDSIVPTGFARVMHSIHSNLPQEDYDFSWLGINYKGDPHDVNARMYPAFTGGDMLGYNRVKEVLETEKPDVLFMLNDIWVLAQMLHILKDVKRLPRIITYFPVDATGFDRGWFNQFGLVSKAVTYTEFGKKVVEDTGANVYISVVPHGIDTTIFHKLSRPKIELRQDLLNHDERKINSFIFLNANRNQPRKRIDIFLEAFKLFSEGKTDPVLAFCHMGMKDAGWSIPRLVERLGLIKTVVTSMNSEQPTFVTDDVLNLIYNACDVGVNTSTGEGWGLVNMEHAVTGAPQIVGKHSASEELFCDCGICVPPKLWLTTPIEGVKHGYLSAEDVAEAMNRVYLNKDLYNQLSEKSIQKFTDPKYSWTTIGKTWDKLIKEVI